MPDLAEPLRPAETFPPGEYLADELAAREWGLAEFAAGIGYPVRILSEVIDGSAKITDDLAVAIARATGTSAKTWLRLQQNHRQGTTT